MTNDEFYNIIKSITSTSCYFYSETSNMACLIKDLPKYWNYDKELDIIIENDIECIISFFNKEVLIDGNIITYEEFTKYIEKNDLSIVKYGIIENIIEKNDLKNAIDYIKLFKGLRVDTSIKNDVNYSIDFLIENRISFVIHNTPFRYHKHLMPSAIKYIQVLFKSDTEYSLTNFRSYGFIFPNEYCKEKLKLLRLYENI